MNKKKEKTELEKEWKYAHRKSYVKLQMQYAHTISMFILSGKSMEHFSLYTLQMIYTYAIEYYIINMIVKMMKSNACEKDKSKIKIRL